MELKGQWHYLYFNVTSYFSSIILYYPEGKMIFDLIFSFIIYFWSSVSFFKNGKKYTNFNE